MKFVLNETYTFKVVDLCCATNGFDYLLVSDCDDKYHRVYNIIKKQYTELPKEINCIVKDINAYGDPKLIQDECALLQAHYELEHYYAFSISDKKCDKNNKTYYVLEDDYSLQRWYTDEDLEIGDDVILYAKDISNAGYIYYVRRHPSNIPNMGKSTSLQQSTPVVNSIFEGQGENKSIEFKTSIVFTPDGKPNIDDQIFGIVRELTSFMNAEGGTLYIGVDDKTKEVIGIEADLPYLKEGASQYASSYSADLDHYELKIRDSLVSLSSTAAGSLIDITFPEHNGKVYCQIDVTKANRPIWVKGNILYQRQGNQVRMLKGENITQFVGERIGVYIAEMVGKTSSSLLTDDMSSLINTAVKNAINDRRYSIAAPIVPQSTDAKYWIVWYTDGTWARKKEKQDGQNIFKQLPVTSEDKDVVIAFCYKKGTVNTIKLSDFKKGTKLNNINNNGYNINEEPFEVFICHPSWLLAVHSANQGGIEYIKLHHLTDFTATKSAKNQGSCIIPKNQGHIIEYKLVSPTHMGAIKKLILDRASTSQKFGFDFNDVTIQQELETLQSL